jgi:hypothetical protein
MLIQNNKSGGLYVFKKGDKVVMHTCVEAKRYDGEIWTCKTDEYTTGEGVYK